MALLKVNCYTWAIEEDYFVTFTDFVDNQSKSDPSPIVLPIKSVLFAFNVSIDSVDNPPKTLLAAVAVA